MYLESLTLKLSGIGLLRYLNNGESIMKIKTIDHSYLKFILLLILMAVFDYFEFISISPFSYSLILTGIILVLQYIPITIFNINLFRKGVQYSIQNEIYLIFSLFIALNAIYVSGLFSSGVYYVLFTDAPILPSMRTSTAMMMLNNGHIDIIDPHYLFPSEYIIVWLISKTIDLSASVSYVIVFGFMKMLLWVSILLILVKIFPIRTVNENQPNSYTSLYYKFLFTIMVLLFIFRPTGFYLGEFTIAGPLFLLLAVFMIKKGLNKIILSYADGIILLLVALGILINSIRDVIALLMVSIFLVLYLLIIRKDLGPVRYVFYLAIILSLARLIYFGAQYLAGYVGYVDYLYHALLTALTIGFSVKRPPLHTIILAPSNIVDKVLNFAGSLDLFILLIIIGLLSLIGTYRSLKKNNGLLAGFALSVFLSFMVVSGVAALAYITNISGYFNLDFETFFSLMPYMYIIPLLYMLLMEMNNKYELKYSKSFTYKFIVSILLFTIVFSSLFATFGLANRSIIRSQTDLSMIHNNPDAATLQVNQLYMFITEYYDKNNIYIGNSGFLQLYLTLPLTYRGIVAINYAYLCNLNIDNNLIYHGQIFYIFLSNNNYIICNLNVILPS
jgi:hypothetical protein